MCHSDNNPTIEQTTAEVHQWVFNVARNSRTRRCPSAGPLKNMYTSTATKGMNLNTFKHYCFKDMCSSLFVHINFDKRTVNPNKALQ